MNLISVTFIVFYLVVLLLWRLLPFEKAKGFLVIVNFLFYGYWFPPYVLVLFASTLINYYCAHKIRMNRDKAKTWFFTALAINLGLLFWFKYTNFFLKTVYDASFMLGWRGDTHYLDIILPLGISFYTFQGLSYVIDVYRKKVTDIVSAIDAFLYLSFFPLLTAGPITRANDFLYQLRERQVVKDTDWQFALYRLCRGFFLKMVIADNIASSSKTIFSGVYAISPAYAWAGAMFFSVQIFCDFAGYSDIALGTARLLGFHLPENFANPYLAAGMSDFWRRWHISLTSWFRDYVYLPLSLSTWMRDHIYIPLSKTPILEFRTDINFVIMFLLSGLWHGPQWTFVLWGGVHGLGAVVDKHLRFDWSSGSKWGRLWLKTGLVFITFLFVTFAWVPFASASLSDTFLYWKSMFVGNFQAFTLTDSLRQGLVWFTLFLVYLVLVGLKEAKVVTENEIFTRIESWAYFALVLLIPGATIDFIYARF